MNRDNISLVNKENNKICNYNYNYNLQYFILYEKIKNKNTNNFNHSKYTQDSKYTEDSEDSEDSEDLEDLDNVDKQYHYDFLKVFNLEDYDPEIIDKIILELFNDLITNERLRKIMITLANSHFSENHDIGFVMMFSFHYFYILHKIINSYYTSCGIINDIFLDELENKINK
jgi:hypothetical protein